MSDKDTNTETENIIDAHAEAATKPEAPATPPPDNRAETAPVLDRYLFESMGKSKLKPTKVYIPSMGGAVHIRGLTVREYFDLVEIQEKLESAKTQAEEIQIGVGLIGMILGDETNARMYQPEETDALLDFDSDVIFELLTLGVKSYGAGSASVEESVKN